MRQGFLMVEACVYVVVSTILVYVVFASVSRLIVPLHTVRHDMQEKASLLSVLWHIVDDGRQCAPDQIVALHESYCIWRNSDNKHVGWVFEGEKLYYCSGVFSTASQTWSRVRKQVVLIGITKGVFDSMVYDAGQLREYMCAITYKNHEYRQRIVLQDRVLL